MLFIAILGRVVCNRGRRRLSDDISDAGDLVRGNRFGDERGQERTGFQRFEQEAPPTPALVLRKLEESHPTPDFLRQSLKPGHGMILQKMVEARTPTIAVTEGQQNGWKFASFTAKRSGSLFWDSLLCGFMRAACGGPSPCSSLLVL
jgi:hypothetical protein